MMRQPLTIVVLTLTLGAASWASAQYTFAFDENGNAWQFAAGTDQDHFASTEVVWIGEAAARQLLPASMQEQPASSPEISPKGWPSKLPTDHIDPTSRMPGEPLGPVLPEPGSLFLVGSGLVAISIAGRRGR